MNRDIVIVGGSGHAKVCIEILRSLGERVAFCVAGDDTFTDCVGVPVLVGDEHLDRLREQGYGRVFVAIGSSRLRQRLAAYCEKLGYEIVSAVSPQALISPTVHLGRGVAVMPGAVINADTVIGDLAIVNTGATIDHDCRIGAAVHIAPQCGLAGNVTVGDHSFLGVGTKVIDVIRIGERVMLGAGSVVVADIDSDVTAVGVPARVIKSAAAKGI